MKLNKKGITSVELLICFIIISAIVVSMYNLILNYKNKAQIEAINNEVIAFSNNLQKVIQNDLIMGHLVDITSISEDGHSAQFVFDSPSEYKTTLTIKPDEGVISYGKEGDIIDYKIPSIADLTLSSDSKIEYISASNGYLKITIVLNHPNFDNETYSFMINCPITSAATVGDLPVSDVVIDNLTCEAIYDDGEETFITSNCGDPNNYIWYSGKLWRAISVNNEAKTTKLITQWNVSALSFDNTTSSFEKSDVKEWLNDTSVDGFLGNLRDYENFIVLDTKWNYTNTELEMIKPPDTMLSFAPVGLLNLYEYKATSIGGSLMDRYLINTHVWWTLFKDSYGVRYIFSNGGSMNNSSSARHGIRPSIVLKSDVRIAEGDGTIDNPYRLMGDNDKDLTGTKLNTRYSGEYIRFGNDENNLYMIVSHETPGLTKIASVEPLKDSGTFKISEFGSDATFSSTNTIGSFLNGDYLTNYVGDTYSNMIEDSTTWYLGAIVNGSGSYKLAKYTDDMGTTLTTNTTVAKVGLLRYGELGTGQYEKYLEADGKTVTGLTSAYWLLTPEDSNHVNWINEYGYGEDNQLFVKVYGIRPAMNLKSNVIITGGDGTKNNPFTLALE